MEDLESMKDAIDRQDAEKMRVAKAAMGKKVQAVVDVAEAEISNSTSAAYQNKLRDEITGLSGALAGLNAKADAAFAAPKDAAAAAALAEASKLVLDKMAALEATVANNSSSIAPVRSFYVVFKWQLTNFLCLGALQGGFRSRRSRQGCPGGCQGGALGPPGPPRQTCRRGCPRPGAARADRRGAQGEPDQGVCHVAARRGEQVVGGRQRDCVDLRTAR